MEKRGSYVYMLANQNNSVLYIGSTCDFKKRIYLHKKRLLPGFTKKYNVDKLVYFEVLMNDFDAKAREKQLKGYRRDRKDQLIEASNPSWVDLWEEVSLDKPFD